MQDTRAAAVKKAVRAIGFKAEDADGGVHGETLVDLSGDGINPRSRLSSSQEPCQKVPINPSHAGAESSGGDGAQNGAGLGIELMDLVWSAGRGTRGNHFTTMHSLPTGIHHPDFGGLFAATSYPEAPCPRVTAFCFRPARDLPD